MKTPIDVWPTIKHTGRRGYSANHFAMLAGGQDDPLRIAERLRARAIGTAVAAEAGARLEAGESYAETLAWQRQELATRLESAWRMLCQSFVLVIGELEKAPQTPDVKRALKVAKKAAKAAGSF